MKSAVISTVILTALFILVGINTVAVDSMLGKTIAEVDNLNFDNELNESFEVLHCKYEKYAKYINLTVSHVMMSEVEEAFAEMEGTVKARDEDGFIGAKSRLVDALCQLKRLAGLSLDSII